jgi:diguanylate cyclase (GGDEF)-like protein
VPDSEVRRFPAAVDAPLARLHDARDELTKAWLLRLLERASLDEIERMPTDRAVREMPAVIAAVASAVAGSESGAVELPESALQRAHALAELRAAVGGSPGDVAQDVAALQSVLIGALRRELGDRDPHVFVAAVERIATAIGALQAAAIEALLGRRAQELEHLANTDPLTELYNVRFLQDQLRHLHDGHERYGHPFSLLLLDIDGLKRVNDSRGHAAGDRVLRAVAAAVRGGIRSVDMAVRMGGDEFCVVAPQQTASRAAVAAHRIAEAVEAAEDQAGVHVRISIGVVSCPQHAVDPERLLELGDSAMYRAKAAGERVAVAGPDGPPAATRAR